LTLVHQQLDLLATTVFRWSGQAWPGVPMEWSIHEDREGAGRHADAQAQAPTRRWTTTLSLSLPNLGVVDVRLSLTGDAVQARVVANEAATRADLRGASSGLARRLEGVGLRLQELQVAETVSS
jgi:flagellar hook-length control protein FliK